MLKDEMNELFLSFHRTTMLESLMAFKCITKARGYTEVSYNHIMKKFSIEN